MKSVLVVDDEFGIADLLADVLGEEGYRVATAASGRQALAQMRAERPDVVLLDFMMPGLNGAGVLKAMAAAPELAGIPVAMMSSLGESTIGGLCDGYAAFLLKPFRLGDVIETVARLANPAPKPT